MAARGLLGWETVRKVLGDERAREGSERTRGDSRERTEKCSQAQKGAKEKGLGRYRLSEGVNGSAERRGSRLLGGGG